MKIILTGVIFFLAVMDMQAQDDLLSELVTEPTDEKVVGTFKGTRVINAQSVETKPVGSLEFIFSHRFGRIDEGSYTLWGLDESYVRLGLEYGISDRFGIGIGRTSVDKTIDSYVRFKIFTQRNGSKKMPFTVTALTAFNYRTDPKFDVNSDPIANIDKIAYVSQVLIARKFNSNLSLQLNPIYVHRNLANQALENNDDFAIGIAGRYKITRSMAITGEYIYRATAKDNVDENFERFDAIGIGLDIETGGHVFQLVFTNSLGLIERAVVTDTLGDFWDGDIHFGFNITRTFQLSRKK